MKIKKYIGQTAHEAMLKLKMELGPDAVVLNTKTIRAKGFWGFLKKPLVEITAAFEEKDLLKVKSINNYESKLNNINEELIELKNIMKNIPVNKNDSDDLVLIMDEWNKRLINNGVDPFISSKLLKEIEEQFNLKEKDNATIKKIVRYSLSEILGSPQSIQINEKQKIIYFIGPTGVGKTTTLAKIAANLVLENKYDIGLITSDTYRIAAVEQLKIYSEILQLPLEIAYNTDDMTKSLNSFNTKDVIFVDTAGRNHNDYLQLEELKKIMNATENKEVFLLINATIDFKVLNNLLDKYNFIDNYKLIITKIDEAENYGNILNIKYFSNKELSYYTTGQNVPDDIKIVSIEDIVEKLIEEKNHHGSGR
ncbi:flagellar biosynthesis protein FlhF [Tissierella sp.]|uniref:flagellar biosynthesis protein FlhF n=1 Tax=Tissierella sp. TaxID=41274 RepID=UPI0028579106|nr:flagellar biosynthesis protein FlhF [Tissierella sp.]MDR7856251.1 flagellar biosynthesis protein FlhF [Tissierella sp.]